jgi:hypothetical protein
MFGERIAAGQDREHRFDWSQEHLMAWVKK